MNYDGVYQRGVACRRQTEAFRLLGVSDSRLRRHGGQASSRETIELFCTTPGVVYQRPMGRTPIADWEPLACATPTDTS